MSLPPEKKSKSDAVADAGHGAQHLPEKVIVNILKFVPIPQVFSLIRVNKKWRSAALNVIRNKQRIQFGAVTEETHSERLRHMTQVSSLDTIFTLKGGMEEGMWNCLMLMTSLKVIVCADFLAFDTGCDKGSGLRSLVQQNCRTLETLILDPDTDFPVSRSKARITTFFPSLKVLTCPKFYSTIVTACPHLESVSCYESSIAALDNLTVTRLEGLEVNCIDFRSEQIQASVLVEVLSQYRKMVKLDLYVIAKPGNDCSPFVKIFSGFTRLEEVLLTLYPTLELDMDAAIQTLAVRNPLLRKLHLEKMRLTDACLRSLSRLDRLSDVRIASAGAEFSEEGVIQLLRGRGRSSLRSLYLSCKCMFGIVLLQQEFQVIAQEVGRSPALTVKLHHDILLSDDDAMSEVSSVCSEIEGT